MAHRTTVKTTYEQTRTIQPIYTGGSVALSGDGTIIATSLGEEVLLSDLSTGRELARVEGDDETITSLALTPNASHLIICSRSLSIRIFPLRKDDDFDGKIAVGPARTLRKKHTAAVVSLAVDRTGTLVATGGADGIVTIWDIRGGYDTHNFHGHGGLVTSLCFFEVNSSTTDSEAVQKAKKNKRQSQEQTDGEKIMEANLGLRLASGAEDGKIRVWNLGKGSKSTSIATLSSHSSVVRSLDFSPEENALLSASRDRTAVVYDAKTWKERRTLAVAETLESAGFLEDGYLIYTGGENGRVRIWVTEGGRELTEEQEAGSENDAIVEILHRQDLPFLLSIHADQTLALFSKASLAGARAKESIPPLELIRRISGTHDEVIDLAYVGRDRSHLALATNLEDIRIISVPTAQQNSIADEDDGTFFGSDVALLKGHDDIIICLDADWSGHWLATGAKDNTARLWRLDPENDSFECYATFTGHAESLSGIALPHTIPPPNSPAHSDPLRQPPAFLITGSQDKTVKRWDTSMTHTGHKKASRAVYTRKAHEKEINALDTSPDGTLFASASQDRTVKIWDTETGESIGVLRGHRRGVWTVRFAPTGLPAIKDGGNRGVIATGSGDKTVRIWSLADYSCLQTFEGHTNSVLKVVWLPYKPLDARDKRGAQVASAAGDGLVKVWDTQSGEEECTLDNHIDRVWALTVNPETNIIVSGAADSVITFWRDTTSATIMEATTRETERVEQDQRLQNLIHSSNYREAIVLALQLDHPARLYSIFRSVMESDPPDAGSITGKGEVDAVLASLDDEQILRLLLRVRDWNTRNASIQVAQTILMAIFKSYDADRLASIKARTKGLKSLRLADLYDGLQRYSESHYRRTEELCNDAFLVDMVLSKMNHIGLEGAIESQAEPVRAIKNGELDHDMDV